MLTRSTRRPSQVVLPPEDLRLLRLKRGLTLRELSRVVALSPGTLCMMESGKRPISAANAMRLLRVLMFAAEDGSC